MTMAETTTAPATPGRLRFDNHFCPKGEDPYGRLSWRRVDVEIRHDATGEVVFSQRGVEVPEGWSDRAARVVSSKFFHGDRDRGDDPRQGGRETSVRQLVDRVCRTIARWGEADGVFATEADADRFQDELAALCLGQMAAFNSPVWFNVGLHDHYGIRGSASNWIWSQATEGYQQAIPCDNSYKYPQASACFIQSVSDDMRGIMDLAVSEAMLFKYGSGTGTDLSTLRSSREKLSSGGRPSGPVSFMRIYDAGASVIKSGGAVRRAAKMQTLRCDHPDILEFIDAKAKEDRKARGLLASGAGKPGMTGDYDEAYSSVFFQNCNMSVRVTDEFLRAAEAGEAWTTREVTTGNPSVSYPASMLVDRIAENTWTCGDPGMQYHDEINRWHTCPNTAPINSSNPCCFVGETLVRTSEGTIEIGMLAGMHARGEALPLAFSFDFGSGIPVLRPIVRAWKAGEATRFVEVRTDKGLVLRCTPEHRFYLRDGRAVEAKDLQPGMRLRKIGRGEIGSQPRTTIETKDDTFYQSRWMWEQANGPIPPGFEVHHVNEDRRDDRLSNFELIASGPHKSLHSRGEANPRYIDVDESLLVETWEAIEATPKRTHIDGPLVTPARWNDHVRRHGLKGKVPFAGSPTFGGRIRGMTWDEFSEWIEARRTLVNDVVMSAVAVETGVPIPVYDIEVAGTHNFEVTCGNYRHGVIVSNSEYMFIDDSACNLASINLRKFVREDGRFDEVGFRKAVRVMIVAQEILVDHASYPTAKIAVNSHRFRPLGLGYANLGALLMARGLPYDSEEGRSLAAAITSVMNGAAYCTSAEIAAFSGAFDGYAENLEPMLGVVDMHWDHARDLARDSVGDEARRLASIGAHLHERARKMGEAHGFRNSQVTLLAPTGTIAFMMDCDTTGIEPAVALVAYKSLSGGGTMKIVNRVVPAALEALGYGDADPAWKARMPPMKLTMSNAILDHLEEHGTVEGALGLKPEHLPVFDCAFPPAGGSRSIAPMGHLLMMAAVQPFLSGAISKCLRGDSLLTTERGLVRIGSLHRGEAPDTFRDESIRVASLGGDRETDAFYYGGRRPVFRVRLRSGHHVVSTPNHPLLVAGDGGLRWVPVAELQPGDYVATRYGAEMWPRDLFRVEGFTPPVNPRHKPVRIPEVVDESLAFLIGAFLADGNYVEDSGTVVITKGDPAVRARVMDLWKSVFGLDSVETFQEDRCSAVRANSKVMLAFLKHLGVTTGSATKRVPDCILRSPRRVVVAFLSGLCLDSYVTTGASAKWAICLASNGLLDDLSAILTNLGVVHSRISKWNPRYERYYDEIYAAGEQAKPLLGMVTFVEPHKAEAATRILNTKFSGSTADVVPDVVARDIYDLLPVSKSGRYGRSVRRGFTALLDPRTKMVSRRMLERVAAVEGVALPEWLRTVVDDGLHFSPVVSVEPAGVEEVFDVSVPGTHAFVANGIVNHNTVNCPETITPAEIRDLYMAGWKHGLKALAIYRDGSKAVQPLTTADPAKGGAGVQSFPAATAPALAASSLVAPARERLPDTRKSLTHHFNVDGHDGYVTVGLYPDGRPGEVFVTMSKEGSTIGGLMDALGTAISIGLQYGVPLDVFVNKLAYSRFDPWGPTPNPDIPMARSIADYVFRWLGMEFLPDYRRNHAPHREPASSAINEIARVESTRAASDPPSRNGHPAPVVESHNPRCRNCGGVTERIGPCYTCTVCGEPSGCS